MPKRDWSGPRAKVEAEGNMCRVCGKGPAEAAHIIPRSRIAPGPAEDPRNICPLCRVHHAAFDHRCFDLLPYLSREEQAYAVELVGFVEAGRRFSTRIQQEAA